MNAFKKKRAKLETFVREQIIGPGSYNLRFFFLEDWQNSGFAGKNLKEGQPIKNLHEIIPEVPAYQYSSGILFPETREIVTQEQQTTTQNESKPNQEIEVESNSADDENMKDDSSESIISKQQNYPNSLGLTFAVNESISLESDLKVNLTFRTYKKVKKKQLIERRFAHWVPEYCTQIEAAIGKYFQSFFGTEWIDGNLFIFVKNEISGDNIYEIDYGCLNQYLKDELIDNLSDHFPGNVMLTETDGKGVSYFGQKGERSLYSFNPKKFNYENVYTLFDNSLIDYIKGELGQGIENYDRLKLLIESIEIYKQLQAYVTNLKSVFKKNKPTPIWESVPHKLELTLPSSENVEKVYRSKELIPVDSSSEELAGLRFAVQYVKFNDLANNLMYIKIVLVNKNLIELEEGEPPQLNKKDKANEISFFGVRLTVTETKVNSLQQYNPPQLLSFDEEDNFNKIIYRNYVDYGEGYNTSVDWGTNPGGLKFVTTEFLPDQETPSVDYVPSKIEKNKVVNRIEDEQGLEIRYLSSLSKNNVSDSDVIKSLRNFIQAYGGETGWINDKREELSKQVIDITQKKLLEKQLNSCEKDYKRMNRNIQLLESNPAAMSAFRVMNTAMFLQLHHSINKKGSAPFIPHGGESYYKEVQLERDYSWRSFQLAFILLNIDAFVRPDIDDKTVEDIFKTGWPERNEIADLVWFPTGGGKTEAYLGIIGFTIAFRRFTKGIEGFGTTVLMRYTLRLLTLQQFQRATMLICALEVIRKDNFNIGKYDLGEERITIGLFVGQDSLPNYWDLGEKSMVQELLKISQYIRTGKPLKTNIPFTECPWCGGNLFKSDSLPNVHPNPTIKDGKDEYKIDKQLNIACPSDGCTFNSSRASNNSSLPVRIFDDDIYKFPPTLLFGTVDKFASLANNVSTSSSERNKDTRRLFGKGYSSRDEERACLPPELIIQDELHLLLGPLGSAVGLFERSIDYLCTYFDSNTGIKIKPKIVTSTATTRNTDKQIFALFNRRSEIFPKQGISCEDSFFSFYKRSENNIQHIESNRKYVGVLPVGKTQVWMHLRVSSIALVHRLKYLREKYELDELFGDQTAINDQAKVFDYYHTVLAYFNSLKDVGKTQSQLSHYLPGDINYVTNNTVPWNFLDKILRSEGEVKYSELTGRLTGEEVKTNLSDIESTWRLISNVPGKKPRVKTTNPPEYVISTNMISVGIDVPRFNTMVICSMPRNIAEYIQASSRVARDEAGIVFTIHHPFRSRDISHYQKFKEFHEKFYSYVEPISVTPYAAKALDRYLAMYVAVLIRHDPELGLANNESAVNLTYDLIKKIKGKIKQEVEQVLCNANRLEEFLTTKPFGMKSSIDGIISDEEVDDLLQKVDILLNNWIDRLEGSDESFELRYRFHDRLIQSLFVSASNDNYPNHWKVSHSLREIDPSSVIKTVQQ